VNISVAAVVSGTVTQAFVDRGFSYVLTPVALTGTAGRTTSFAASQPSQHQLVSAVANVNGNPAAFFSWAAANGVGFAFGTWTLVVQEDPALVEPWRATCTFKISKDASKKVVHFDSSSTSCTEGGPDLQTWP
jgi:hypothetical protein